MSTTQSSIYFLVCLATFWWAPGSFAGDFSADEKVCFEQLFEPAQQVHNLIHQRARNQRLPDDADDDDDGDLEDPIINPIPVLPFDLEVIRRLLEYVSLPEITTVGDVVSLFRLYLEKEEQFFKDYQNQLKNIKYTAVIGGGSIVIGLLSLLPLGLAQLAEVKCEIYECVFDNDVMIETENGNGGPTHFCFAKGVAADCGQYAAVALGLLDLRGATYVENCSKKLQSYMINTPIPLAQIRFYTNQACQAVIRSLPAISALSLVPGLILGSKTVVQGVQLKRSKTKLDAMKTVPATIDTMEFQNALGKIRNISPALADIAELAGSFLSILPASAPIAQLFENDAFHQAVVEMLGQSGFGATCKAAWASFRR